MRRWGLPPTSIFAGAATPSAAVRCCARPRSPFSKRGDARGALQHRRRGASARRRDAAVARRPVIELPVALAYAFGRSMRQPAAARSFRPVWRASTTTDYNCRTIHGRRELSEHAFANAIDVSAFGCERPPRHGGGRLPPRRRQGPLPAPSRDGACRWFSGGAEPRLQRRPRRPSASRRGGLGQSAAELRQTTATAPEQPTPWPSNPMVRRLAVVWR